MAIIAEYSDFEVDTINYFIDAIKAALETRGFSDLTNNQVDIINVSKEHPLVQYMASRLAETRNADDQRAGVLPAISVTPGNMDAEMETMGLSPETFTIDDTYIAYLKTLYNETDENIQKIGIMTKPQIESILSAYRKKTGLLRCQKNSWAWNEEVNVSCWAESPDYDTLMARIVDSVLAKLKVGVMGDNSPIRKMKYKPVRGLTNFNYGRVLYGSEFNLTFFNIYSNYTIFTDDYIDSVEFDPTFITPGEEP